MKTFITIGLFIFLSGVAVISCDQRPSTNEGENSANPEVEVHNVCDLRRLGITSQSIRVKGQIGGYHEIFLYSENCRSNDNLLQLKIDYDELQILFKKLRELHPNQTDLSGTIVVTGKLIPGGGILYSYPVRVIDPDKPSREEQGLIVDRFDVVSVESFVAY